MDGAFPSQRGEGFNSEYGPGRGQGSPMAGRGGGRSGFRGTAENAKTKMCNRWMQGDCRFGDRCNFAHGEAELRALTGGGPPGAPRSQDGTGGPGRMPYGGRGRGGYNMGYAGRGYQGRGRGGYGYGSPQGGYGYGLEGQQGPYDGGRGGAGPMQTDAGAWAASGYPTTGPNGWVMYKAKETGEAYFHNHRTNVTQWERPTDWPA